tara:strand:- start:290 stop:1576 length:1287 start_codon:yes stop_codon:yes gene_type:complete
MPTGKKTENLQGYNVRATADHMNVLKTEGAVVDAMSFGQVQEAFIRKEEEGEVSSSDNTSLGKFPDEFGGSVVTVNGVPQSSGSSGVGQGLWVGTISGSVDFFIEKRSSVVASIVHTPYFSGSFSSSDFNTSRAGKSYSEVVVGAPPTNYYGSGQVLVSGLQPKSFSGSFWYAGRTSGDTPERWGLHTPESGSMSSSGESTAAGADRVPGGTFTAKWISGSFNTNVVKYAASGAMLYSDVGTKFYTSSNFTEIDLNNMSQSDFVGSLCAVTGGFARDTDGPQIVTRGMDLGGYYQDAVYQMAFGTDGIMQGKFSVSGSLLRNDQIGAEIFAVQNGSVFTVQSSGSNQHVSASLESFPPSLARDRQGWVQRGPKQAFKNGSSQKGYFGYPRTVNINGAISFAEKKTLLQQKTANFSKLNKKMTNNPYNS